MAAFFNGLAPILEELIIHSCPVLVGGDFIIHVHKPTDPNAVRLAELWSSFYMRQHVAVYTYQDDGTLDLITSLTGFNLYVDVDPRDTFSDLLLVACRLSFASMPHLECSRIVRSFQRIVRQVFRWTVEGSALFSLPADDQHIDKVFATNDSVTSLTRRYHLTWSDGVCSYSATV